MKGPNPAPLPPSVYSHYGVDRRTLAHPDIPDRRTIQPSDLVDRRAIPPPEHLDRRHVPPFDLVDRRGIPPPDHLERRGVPPPDLVDRRAIPPPDHLERRGVPPPDFVDRRPIPPDHVDRRGIPPPDHVDRRGIPPPDLVDRRGIPPHDLVDRRGIPPPDLVDRRGIPPPDLVDRRGIPPHDLVDRRGIPVPDLDRCALPPPDALERRAIPPPELIDRRMVAPPDGLERRTIALSDGSIRTYFALPPDPPPFARAYHVLDQLPQPISLSQPQTNLTLSPNQERSDKAPERENEQLAQGQSTPNSSKSDKDSERSGAGPSAPKRKHEQEEARSSKREKTGSKDKEKEEKGDKGKAPLEVNKKDMLDAFLKMSKLVNESSSQKRNYLSEGRHGPLRCIVCESYERESKVKDFVDLNALLMHAFNAIKHPGLLVKHRALHKALCVLMGWDSSVEPTNSKGYQRLFPDQAQANRDDLILWPPMVVIQNTSSSSKKDGRFEGMGNKEMDAKLSDLGFTGGKSKSLYGREGHQGVTIVRFSETLAGLKEAERLTQLFEKSGQGRKNWIEVQKDKDKNRSSDLDTNTSDKNPTLVTEFGSGERRVLYGYLATASDLEILDSDAKKRAVVRSRKESDFPDN